MVDSRNDWNHGFCLAPVPPLEVVPVIHYTMGGIAINVEGGGSRGHVWSREEQGMRKVDHLPRIVRETIGKLYENGGLMRFNGISTLSP